MEQEIIHKALEALKQTTGIHANFKENGPLDGLLEFVWSMYGVRGNALAVYVFKH